jgi:hypothetical protein
MTRAQVVFAVVAAADQAPTMAATVGLGTAALRLCGFAPAVLGPYHRIDATQPAKRPGQGGAGHIDTESQDLAGPRSSSVVWWSRWAARLRLGIARIVPGDGDLVTGTPLRGCTKWFLADHDGGDGDPGPLRGLRRRIWWIKPAPGPEGQCPQSGPVLEVCLCTSTRSRPGRYFR